MKRLAAILLLLLAACGTNPTPQPPKPPTGIWDVSVAVFDNTGRRVAAAHVELAGVAKDANDFGWAYYTLQAGCYPLHVTKQGYTPADQQVCVDRHTRVPVTIALIAPPTPRLQPNGRIFYQDGKPWRWKGVTAFGLLNKFCQGTDIDPFLNAFQGFNVLRVFYYVEWPGTGWGIPPDECLHQFLTGASERGWYVELVALTGPKPIAEAQALVNHLFQVLESHPNALLELVNEPRVHDKVEPNQLTIPTTSVIWTDGLTVADHRGAWLNHHSSRDNEWVRRAHDFLEFWTGGGPNTPSDPAWKQPAIADEPAKPQDVPSATWDIDFRAYFAACSMMAGGATFHAESIKYGDLPTDRERQLAKVALDALNAFPEDTPLFGYRRIDENGATLRTYVVGNAMVRMRPTNKTAPEPGWVSLDDAGVLWSR